MWQNLIQLDRCVGTRHDTQAFRVFFPSLFSLSPAQFSGRVRSLSAEEYSNSGYNNASSCFEIVFAYM